VALPLSIGVSFFGTDSYKVYHLGGFCRAYKQSATLVVLALPLGVGALEVFYAVFVEDPEAGGYFVDQVVVVGD
jgi:hypothetical protein